MIAFIKGELEYTTSTEHLTKTEFGQYSFDFRVTAPDYKPYYGTILFKIVPEPKTVNINGKEYVVEFKGFWLGACYGLIDVDEDGKITGLF